MGKNYPSNRSKEGSIQTKNLDFRVHVCTFGAEKSLKIASLRTKNDAQTLRKQLQNKFEKVQKTTFFHPKIAKMTFQIGIFHNSHTTDDFCSDALNTNNPQLRPKNINRGGEGGGLCHKNQSQRFWSKTQNFSPEA